MKTSLQNSARFIAAGLGLLLFLLANHAGATTTTWDPQGTTTTPAYCNATCWYTGNLTGTWETSKWSTSQTGQATPQAWVEGTAAVFAVHSGTGTPAFTVTMNANHTVAGMFNGPLTPNPCPVTINGTGTMTMLAGNLNGFEIDGYYSGDPGSVTINTVIAGGATAPVCLEGYGYAQIYLNAANTYSGGTWLGYSGAAFYCTVNFNNSASFGTGSIVVSNTAGVNCGFVLEGSSAITIPNPVVWANSGYNDGVNFVGNAAGLTFSGPWTLSTTARIGSAGAGNLVTISGVMSGAGGLNYSVSSTPGQLELTAINTYTGTTTITNGALQLGDGVSKSGNIAGPITITPPGSLVWANPTAITYSKVMSGTGAVTNNGPGVLTLSGASTYSGGTVINGTGTVKVGVANALPTASDLLLTGTLDLGAFSTGVGALNGTGMVTNSTGAATYTLTVGGNGNSGTFSGIITDGTTGAVALTKSGAGTETLSSANNYSGNTIISAGILQLGVANAIPAGSSVSVATNATLDLQGYSPTIAALSVSGLSPNPGQVINYSGTLTVNGNAAAALNGQNYNGYSCISAGLSGTSLIKGGTHAMAFRGDSSGFGGGNPSAITLSGGVLSVGAAPNRLPTGMALAIPGGALFQLDANNQTIADLTGSGNVNLGGGILTLSPGDTPTFSGVIQNSELPGSSTALGNGLRGYYYTNIDMTSLKAVTDNAQVNVNWGPPNGYALACNGTSTGYGALVNPSGSLTGTYTVECWAYPSNTTANMSMIGTRRPTDYGFDMKFDGGGVLIHGDIGNGTAWVTTTADAPFTFLGNTWYHIAYVVTPTNYTIYANGNQIGGGTYTSTTPVLYDASHTNIYIGQYGAGEYFNGQLGEVRMWNTARTATQIQTNMNRQLVGNETGLVGYWRCNDGSGTILTATVGVNGTLAASTGWAATIPPAPTSDYGSARWLGQVLTTVDGTYTFTTTTGDGARLWVNGTLVIDDWVGQGTTAQSGAIALTGNTRYDIVMECFNGAAASLSWMPPGDSNAVVIPSANLYLPGPGSLVMGGPGTQELTGASTYSGGTTVSGGGLLQATVNGALGSGSVTVENSSSLELDASDIINTNADLILLGANQINLSFTGTNYIHGLYYDGGYAAPGTYGVGPHAIANPDGVFTGNGYVQVTAAASANVLTASTYSTVYGTPITLTSTITGSGPTPTGTVTFWDGANWLGASTLSGGVATLSVSNLAVFDSHSVTAVYGGDANYATSTSSAISITTSVATITAVPAVANKTYDGTTAATITAINFTGILPGDTNYVHVATNGLTYGFSDPYVGVNKTVNVSGMVLSGSLDGNYALSSASASTTASITNKVVTISGITATNRVYDANTDAGVTGTAGLVGVLAADTANVNLGGTPVFAFTTKTVGTAKPVTVSGYTLLPANGIGTNYILVLTNLSANVSNFPVAIINVTANSKTYDGTTTATLSGTPALSPAAFGGDIVNINAGSVVANFTNANVNSVSPYLRGVTVTGYALTGADAANYTNSQPTGLSANINQAQTSTTINSSPNPSTVGSNVTFTLTVTSTTTTTRPPTGTATFYTNSVPIGTGTLVSNTPMSSIGSYTTAGLPLGTTPVEAQYGGDVNFIQPFSAASTNQVVQSGTTCSQTNDIVSVTQLGGNWLLLTNIGTYQAQYYILSQTNVGQPLANWLVVPGSTNTVTNANGLWSFTVTNPAPAFYRVKAINACGP